MRQRVKKICFFCKEEFSGHGREKWCQNPECQQHKKNWQKGIREDDQGPDHPLTQPAKYPPHQCSCGCGKITTNRFLSDDCMMVRSWGPSMEDGEMYF